MWSGSLASPSSAGDESQNPSVLSRPAEIGTIVGALCGIGVLLVAGLYIIRKIVRSRSTRQASNSEVRHELAGEDRKHEASGDPKRQELRGHEFSQELI